MLNVPTTVKVATALVTLPKAFAATRLKVAPLSAGYEVTNDNGFAVAPEIGLPFLSQIYETGGAPSTMPSNLAGLPAFAVVEAGSCKITGGKARFENEFVPTW